MPDYRLKTPKVLWGAGLVNTLLLGTPLDQVRAGSEPREGFETARTPAGVADAWDPGEDFVLEGTVRWIPQVDTVAPAATGWDGVTGFRAFLAWARRKNTIRFYPDAAAGAFIDSELVEPLEGLPDPEDDGTRTLPIKIRNTVSAYDGY